MAIEYRKLTEKDLTTFIELRIGQLREEGAKEDFDLRPNLLDYYKRHMADGTFVSWLAVDSDPCCKRGKSLRLRLCPDYCIRHGRAFIHKLRLCKKRQLYAICYNLDSISR